MTPRRALLWGAGALLCGLFLALGVWQVQRLAWKNDLVARVAARAHADPVAAPAPDQWPALQADPSAHEYRRVQLTGGFLHESEQLVQAVTDQGAGFWVMAPLRAAADHVVWVNRGFVPSASRWQTTREAARCGGPVTVTGLLRRSEPGGGFLRRNDPAAGRWFSRDVPALAAAAGLPPAAVAPYFVDAGADTPCATPQGPVGGLTVLRFANNHLVYALTWFALAAMTVAATVFAARDGARRRLPGQSGASS
ncbi:SURF1 family protein [Hydrogenophaga pseudoflava]|uniref:SURF1 family protein n=1 Tax=Hydrogenophaga pseudoflava TaxID=47421 RepID=UPI0027E4B515|nr:SURF1 family protein [Hydrogenophaga pseudoflava]MDQ7746704.1 SURF1 family protein [Hydrogenophaga pseudoflava]